MAKKLVAVTEIRHDDLVIQAGEALDTAKFEKSQLEALYDAGAVRVEEGADEPKAEDKNAETPKTETSAEQSAAASSPAGEPKTPAAAKSTAPAVKETTSAKGTTK